jgi:hypothetical protein
MEADWWCSSTRQWIGNFPMEAILKACSTVNFGAHKQDYPFFSTTSIRPMQRRGREASFAEH